MPDYLYTATQIAELTEGHVVQKTLNNWANHGHWRSAIQPADPGRPRLYSRANVLEAVIGSRLQIAGIARRDFLTVIRVMGSRARSVGYVATQFDYAAEHVSFATGSEGWYWAIARKVIGGDPVIYAADTVSREHIAEWIEKEGGDCNIILPISEIVAAVDALEVAYKVEG